MKKESTLFKLIAGIFLFLLIPNFVNATQINVGGNITTATTWNADTVNVTSNVVITSTGALTIPSGTKVVFQSQYSITVQGSISAVGTITWILTKIGLIYVRMPVYHYITFSYKHATITAGDTTGFSSPSVSTVGWLGITLSGGSKGNFYLCQFQLAKSLTNSLFINNGNTSFKSCLFHDNKTFSTTMNGILFSSPTLTNDSLILSNSSFYKSQAPATVFAIGKFNITGNNIYNNTNTSATHINDRSALSITSGIGTVVSNRIYNNSQNGVNVTWSTSVNLDRNNIYNNKNYGITFYNSIITLTNNLIVNNVNAGYVNGTITAFINNTIAYNQTGIGFLKPSLSGGSDAYFYNTIIWNNHSTSTDLYGNMNISINNCLLPYSTIASVKSLGFTVKSFKQNINLDPQFNAPTDTMGWNNDAANAYWAVGSNSPCINAGTTNTDPYLMPTTDYVGTARIKHGYPDVGAYELYIPVDSIFTTTITTPTMWVADTVKVFGNVSVTTGGKLTIAPGTVVSFQGDYYLQDSITCHGIIAQGTIGDSIVFTRQNPILPISSTTGIFWQGINIQAFQNSTDSAIFQYCRFEFAEHKGYWKGAAINVDYNNNVSIKNCVFRYNVSRSMDDPTQLTGDGSAIAAFNSDISIDQCQFTDNLGNSTVFINSSNVNLSNCYFTRNMNDLSFSYAIEPLIINTITRSYDKVTSSNPVFVNCEFYGNKQTSLYSSNPRFYNSVCFDNITWSDQSKPTFSNCMYKITNYTSLAGLTVNPYLPVVSYLSNFVWDEGNDNYALKDYKRNSFYPSINKGTFNLPSSVVLPSIDIQGNARTIGDTIDIGAIEQQGQLPIIKQQPYGDIKCEGKSFTFSLVNADTAVYQWQVDGTNIPNANASTYTIDSIDDNSTGGYQCVLQNAYGSIVSNSALLQVRTAPDITDQPSSTLVNKGSSILLEAKADGSKPLRYQWKLDGINLPYDTTLKLNIDSFMPENEGTYICDIFNNCGSAYTTPAVMSLAPSICMVTVSTPKVGDNGHNLIVWNKESKIKYSRFNIYRESAVAGYYDSIGSVSYSKTGIFEDTLVNPKQQAYLYKITAVDSNNVETDINSSLLHKTIHLITTTGEQGGIQLEWDQYIGFPYRTYYIYRSSNGKDFLPVDSIASSTRAWTDDTVVGPNDTLYYYISVKNPAGTCYPNGNLKAGSDIYSQSVSNMDDNRIRATAVAHVETDEFGLSCYPNPFNSITTIRYNVKVASQVVIELYNTIGDRLVVLVNDNLQSGAYNYKLDAAKMNLGSGIYILKLNTGNKTLERKLVVTK